MKFSITKIQETLNKFAETDGILNTYINSVF
jgi:hypothetical protein